MKAVIMPLAVGALLFAAMSLRLRYTRPKEPARALLALYFVMLPVLVVAYLVTPADLGFLNAQLVAPSRPVELGFAVFLYSAGFFGGLLQLYNLADRGLSLRMLIDILQSPRGKMTAEKVAEAYSGGHGITWMYKKRLEGVTYAGLAEIQDDRLVLTARGWHVAQFFARLQRFARLDATGAR